MNHSVGIFKLFRFLFLSVNIIRGRVSSMMGGRHKTSHPITKFLYLDTNGLYGYATDQPIPGGIFSKVDRNRFRKVFENEVKSFEFHKYF